MEGEALNNIHVGPCAACKHQRKRCEPDCPLARYFPANKYEDFLNVCCLFGVNNMLRLLMLLPEHLRDQTAETLILEARLRREYPVGGGLSMQLHLVNQINDYNQELERVRKLISWFEERKKNGSSSFGVEPHGEATFKSDTNVKGYNYQSTLEDLQLDFTNIGELGESSAKSKAGGKKH